jgi:hypothetical protein
MKTITNGAGEIKRLSDAKAEKEVKWGWKFAPKSLWKKNVRDINKRHEKEDTTAVLDETPKISGKQSKKNSHEN